MIFYVSPSNLTAAIVNLRPIVPHHVLVLPRRVAPRLSDLTTAEHADLWATVNRVREAFENDFRIGGFNIAVQDGVIAGQSVEHVHVHILPRVKGDFEPNDLVYDKLEAWTPRKEDEEEKLERMGGKKLVVKEDKDRKDRTEEQMKEESRLYRSCFVGDHEGVECFLDSED